MKINRIWPFSWFRKRRKLRRYQLDREIRLERQGLEALAKAWVDLSRRDREARAAGEESPLDRALYLHSLINRR